MNDLSKYKHIFIGRVQFSEVDSFGVAHNLKYLYWLEWARTDYLRSIGLKMNPKTFLTEHPIMTVHSEIDYFESCRFNDEYNVYTRISWIKNSSLCFENIITSEDRLLVKASSILVNVNPKTGESVRIDDKLRTLVKKYESDNVQFID